MKLWHDDVRLPPPGDEWVWARNNDQAKLILINNKVEEASLDHDMGYTGPPPKKCETCFGRGKVWYGYNDHDPDEGGLHPCHACDGDGFENGDIFFIAGTDEEDGRRLVEWMVATDNVPPKVTIHSWNPAGAEQMAFQLRLWADEKGPCEVIVKPYDLDDDRDLVLRYMRETDSWPSESRSP